MSHQCPLYFLFQFYQSIMYDFDAFFLGCLYCVCVLHRYKVCKHFIPVLLHSGANSIKKIHRTYGNFHPAKLFTALRLT